MKKTNEETCQLVVDEYLKNDCSLKELGRVSGLSSTTCRKILIERLGSFTRKSPELCSRIHFFNEDFFECINTEEKAYFIGFITADGNVCSTQAVLRINLAEKDKHILEDFARCVGYNGNLKNYTGREKRVFPDGEIRECAPSWTIALHSQKMCKDLLNHGITPRKTITIKPCKNIPENLKRHYWRGVFDGDGCIGEYKYGKSTTWAVQLAGTESIVRGFLEYCNGIFPTPIRVMHRKNLCIGYVQDLYRQQRVMEYLYSESNIHLHRKKELAEKILLKKPRFRTEISPEMIRKEYDEGATVAALARKYKMDNTSITGKIIKAGGQTRTYMKKLNQSKENNIMNANI